MNLSPWHGGVLTTAALLASPAAWSAFVVGTLGPADVLTRFLWCVVGCWLVLNLVLPLMIPQEPARGAGQEAAEGAAQEADSEAAGAAYGSEPDAATKPLDRHAA